MELDAHNPVKLEWAPDRFRLAFIWPDRSGGVLQVSDPDGTLTERAAGVKDFAWLPASGSILAITADGAVLLPCGDRVDCPAGPVKVIVSSCDDVGIIASEKAAEIVLPRRASLPACASDQIVFTADGNRVVCISRSGEVTVCSETGDVICSLDIGRANGHNVPVQIAAARGEQIVCLFRSDRDRIASLSIPDLKLTAVCERPAGTVRSMHSLPWRNSMLFTTAEPDGYLICEVSLASTDVLELALLEDEITNLKVPSRSTEIFFTAGCGRTGDQQLFRMHPLRPAEAITHGVSVIDFWPSPDAESFAALTSRRCDSPKLLRVDGPKSLLLATQD